MSDEKTARENEIARAFLKCVLTDQGFEIDKNFPRRAGNIAKRTGIPFEAVLRFAVTMAKEIIDDVSRKGAPPTKDEEEEFDDRH